MTKKKILVSAAKILGGTFIVLFLILVAHIATAKPVHYDNASMQISRIDFEAPIDVAMASKIKRDLKSIPGVRSERLNRETGTLVYFHDNKIADSKTIYSELMRRGPYSAKRFTVPEEVAARQVCPAMPKDGIAYRFSSGIQKLFNN